MNSTVEKIKCGQIFILPNDNFSLVCEFCEKDYHKLEDFVVHISSHFPETPTSAAIKQEAAVKQEMVEPEICAENRTDVLRSDEQENLETENNLVIKEETETTPPDACDETLTEVVEDDDSSQAPAAESSNEEWELLSVEDDQSSLSTANSDQDDEPTVRAIELQSTGAASIKNTVNDTSNHKQPQQHHNDIVIDLTEENQPIAKKIHENVTFALHNGGFKCNLCDRVIYSKLAFQLHMNIHTGYRPCPIRPWPRHFNCKLCPEKFTLASALNTHIKKKHTIHECTQCDKKYRKKPNLAVHIREKHLPDTDPRRYFVCAACDLKFESYSRLNSHNKLVHIQTSVLTCDYCKRQFNTRSIIEQHMQIHLDSNNNGQCKHCGTTFMQISHRLSHESKCKKKKC